MVARGDPGEVPGGGGGLDDGQVRTAEPLAPAVVGDLAGDGVAASQRLGVAGENAGAEGGERRAGAQERGHAAGGGGIVGGGEYFLGIGIREGDVVAGVTRAHEDAAGAHEHAEPGRDPRTEMAAVQLNGIDACEQGGLAGATLRKSLLAEGRVERQEQGARAEAGRMGGDGRNAEESRETGHVVDHRVARGVGFAQPDAVDEHEEDAARGRHANLPVRRPAARSA